MSDWFTKGCDRCRTAILRGDREPLIALTPPGYSSLHRCSVCGSLWEVNLREAHVITEAEACREFPEAFPQGPA